MAPWQKVPQTSKRGFHRERLNHPTVHVLEVNLPEILAMKVLYKPWRCSPPICSRELRNLPRNPRVTWPIAGWTSTPANTTMWWCHDVVRGCRENGLLWWLWCRWTCRINLKNGGCLLEQGIIKHRLISEIHKLFLNKNHKVRWLTQKRIKGERVFYSICSKYWFKWVEPPEGNLSRSLSSMSASDKSFQQCSCLVTL